MVISSSGNHEYGRVPLGLMLALGYVSMTVVLSTDLYLPSLPDLGRTFEASASKVQLTLTAFLVGIAVGNLFVGSLSDALGRRKVLVIGLGLYALCSLAAALSSSIEMLIALRVLQGFGAASGTVLARAIVSDTTRPQESTRAFATLFVLIGLGPLVATPLGGVLTEFGGWRSALFALGIIAVGMYAVSLVRIPETLSVERRQALHFVGLARSSLRLLRQRGFTGFAVAFGAGYSSMMVYVSSSAFLAQDLLGLTPIQYSLTFAVGSGSFMFGAWLSGRIATVTGGDRALYLAQWLQAGTALAALTTACVGLFSLLVYLVMMVLLLISTGVLMPTASSLAIRQAVSNAGAGSALVGFTQFAFGAVSTPLGGLFGTGTAIPATAAMSLFALIGVVAARRARRAQ